MKELIKSSVVLVMIIMIVQGSAFGQEKKEDIKKLFEVMKTTEMIDKMTENFSQIAQYQMQQSDDNAEMPEQGSEKMQAMMKEMNTMTHEMVNKEMVNLYDEHFSHEEIKQLIEFYSSEVGMKLIEKQPIMQRELMGVMMNEYMPELKEKVRSGMGSEK